MASGFVFIDNDEVPRRDPNIFRIFIQNYQREDTMRYAAKLYFDQGIQIDYNKIVKIALDEYLQNHIGEKQIAEMEAIKKEEKRLREVERKAKLPRFSWDLSKKNKEG